jgi:hypothetical protein
MIGAAYSPRIACEVERFYGGQYSYDGPRRTHS